MIYYEKKHVRQFTHNALFFLSGVFIDLTLRNRKKTQRISKTGGYSDILIHSDNEKFIQLNTRFMQLFLNGYSTTVLLEQHHPEGIAFTTRDCFVKKEIKKIQSSNQIAMHTEFTIEVSISAVSQNGQFASFFIWSFQCIRAHFFPILWRWKRVCEFVRFRELARSEYFSFGIGVCVYSMNSNYWNSPIRFLPSFHFVTFRFVFHSFLFLSLSRGFSIFQNVSECKRHEKVCFFRWYLSRCSMLIYAKRRHFGPHGFSA